MGDERSGRVLVVDDDPQVRELYADFLAERYDVVTADSGESALSIVDDDDVDVILLDRLMPGRSGDEVLAEIRDRGIDCRVAMVTAVEPALDIVELGFDDYIVKPVGKPELHNLVDSLLHWGQYDTIIKAYFNAAQRVAVLEKEIDAEALAESEEYQQLLEELAELREASGRTVSDLGVGGLDRLLAEFDEYDVADSSSA